MLKVLVVMPCYYPALNYGGPVIAVHEMNKALIEMGIEVTVYTTNANEPGKLDVPLGKEIDVDGVKVIYFPLSIAKKYFYAPLLSYALRKNVKDFDLVHINWLYVYTTMAAAKQCARQKVPYILTPHGMLDTFSISLKGSIKKKLYLSLIEKAHIMNASYVHFSSQGEKNEAVTKAWQTNSIVIPNGVAISSLATAPQYDKLFLKYPELFRKKIVLFLGRLNYIKGLDLLLKAWPIVVGRVKNAHLVIAGPDDNGYMGKLKAIADDEGITGQVTFTGMTLGKEKETLLNLSNVFVSSSYLESFGMAIVEAMSHAIPVVITDRVNIKAEILEAGAGLISSCDPKNIATKIIYLLENEEDAIKMGLRGKTLVQNRFEMDLVVREMIACYKNVSECADEPVY